MTTPDEDLVTSEGVDEGSAASTVESPGSGGDPAARGLPDGPDAERAAPPVDTDTEGTEAARGPGQQLEAGEG